MAKKKNNAFLPKLAMVVIFIIAVIYSVYHIISLFSGDDIKTIVSRVTTHKVTVGGVGYVFRDESLIGSDNSGAVDYLVGDGEKVSVEQKIAHVYEGDGAAARRLILIIDKHIDLLEKSSAGAEPLDLATLRQEANDVYYKLVELLASGEMGELNAQIEKMMITLNRISDLIDGGVYISKALDELKAMREELFKGEYQTVLAGISGYFYYAPDGYESDFTLQAADELTPETLDTLISKVEKNEGVVPKTAFGKLSPTSFWKLAVPLSTKDTQGFEEGQVCELTFPENNQTKLSMVLEKKIIDGENDRVICVFYCNRAPSNFNFDRCQSVKIEVATASGIYVPRSALARVDGVRGVYVLRGSVVHFRKVDIVYEGSDYCLVSESSKEEGGYYPLGTNELIITEGKNLFDGRILD